MLGCSHLVFFFYRSVLSRHEISHDHRDACKQCNSLKIRTLMDQQKTSYSEAEEESVTVQMRKAIHLANLQHAFQNTVKRVLELSLEHSRTFKFQNSRTFMVNILEHVLEHALEHVLEHPKNANETFRTCSGTCSRTCSRTCSKMFQNMFWNMFQNMFYNMFQNKF